MVWKPFTRCNKTLPFFSSCECLLSKDTGNSDSQNENDIILETTENTSTRGN